MAPFRGKRFSRGPYKRGFTKRKTYTRTRGTTRLMRNILPSYKPLITQTQLGLSDFGFTDGARNWSGTPVVQQILFKLDQMPDVTSIKALYDQYRIRWVQVRFLPTFNVSDEDNATQSGCIYTVIDYDGDGPTNIDDFGQYKTLRSTRSYKVHTRFIRPRILREIYNNGITSGYEVAKPGVWIDTASSAVNHFGLHLGIDGGNTTAILQIQIKMCVECRNVK